MNKKARTGRVLANCAASLILVIPATAWALDWYLKIDGVKGESTAIGQKEALNIDAWQFGVQGATPVAGRGAKAAAPCMSGMSFVRLADSATPQLLAGAAMGQPFGKAVLVGRKSGEKQQDFLIVEMKNVLVSSISHSGHSESLTEALELRFQQANVSYMPQDEKGGLGKAITATLAANPC